MEQWQEFLLWWHAFTRSDKIASLALSIAAGSLWVSWHYGRPQRDLARRQLLDKVAADKKSKDALIVCRLVGPPNAHRIEFGNRGEADARNVTVSYSDPTVEQLFEEAMAELPWERLRTHSSFSLQAKVYYEHPERYRFNVSWDDDSGVRKTEPQVISVHG